MGEKAAGKKTSRTFLPRKLERRVGLPFSSSSSKSGARSPTCNILPPLVGAALPSHAFRSQCKRVGAAADLSRSSDAPDLHLNACLARSKHACGAIPHGP